MDLSYARKWAGKFLSVLAIVLFPLLSNAATDGAGDVAPSFMAAGADEGGRGYNAISIHPDGEHWLVSECTNRIEPKRFGCYLFLYSRTTKIYRRLDLPKDYDYSDAKFSPTGRWIVFVRSRVPKNTSREEMVRALSESEILMMRADGTDLRILAVPKGRIKAPVISPDESKVAYWVSRHARPTGSKTTFIDFDVHEFDIASNTDALFAGPYEFYLAEGLQYKTRDEIVANAYGPAAFVSSMGKYQEKFGSSEIYFFRRGGQDFPTPAFPTIVSATYPSIGKDDRLYLLGSPRPHGKSIVEADLENAIRRWPIPQLGDQGIASITASPDGAYIVFVYPTTPIRSTDPKNGLGVFDLSEERWIPVSLPLPESASPLPVQD